MSEPALVLPATLQTSVVEIRRPAISEATHKQRSFGLDLIRAVAISMVLIAHGVSLHGVPLLGDLTSGVDLFFVLSGFLIGRIYFQSSSRSGFSLLGFWRARWWRTLPPYLAALALSWALALHPGIRPPLEIRATYLLFLQNYTGIFGFTPSWSLCVEEHFYLLLPLAGLAIGRWLGRDALGWFLPVSFFLPTIARVVSLYVGGGLLDNWVYFTHLHSEGLIAGVWLAYVFVHQPALFRSLRTPALWLTPVVPLLLLVLPVWNSRTPEINIYVFTVYAIGFAAWLRLACDIEWHPRPGSPASILHRTVSGLALCSYSLYLTHTQIFVLRTFLPFHRGVAKTLIVFAMGFAGGIAFYYLCERPAIETRDWFERRLRSAKPGVSPS
jgi:peptidoglycan/LPS O-acetylase OafA/YrhL